MISIKHSTEFKKDFKRFKKRNIKNFVNRFQFIVSELVSRNCLKSNFQDHTLSLVIGKDIENVIYFLILF